MDAFLENYQRGHLRDFTQAAVTLHRPILKDVDLIDTPGFDANPRDDDKALTMSVESDFALMVLANKGASQVELNALRRITKAGAPCVILVNCCDQQRWDPASAANKTVAGEIQPNRGGRPATAGLLALQSCVVLAGVRSLGKRNSLPQKLSPTGKPRIFLKKHKDFRRTWNDSGKNSPSKPARWTGRNGAGFWRFATVSVNASGSRYPKRGRRRRGHWIESLRVGPANYGRLLNPPPRLSQNKRSACQYV